MKICRFCLPLVAALLASAGCKKSPAAPPAAARQWEPTKPNPPLSTIQLWLGPAQLTAEMALTQEQEMTGLMFRTNIAKDHGMIFVFPTQQASFWMKNCPLPLSIAYIDPDGVIQEIYHLEPYNTNAVLSVTNNIHYALETAQGWFADHGVRSGMVVRTDRGSLRQVFQPVQ